MNLNKIITAIVVITLIACSTFLAYFHILSSDAWVALISMIGGVYGLSGTTTGQTILKAALKTTSTPTE